jgi:predicted O-methyltransferase YrrM
MDDYKDNGKYPDRIKKDGEYNIDDALQYVGHREFRFTNNWFERNINISMKILQKLFNNKKVRILEIGSHEGQSAIWMLENLCIQHGSAFTSIDPYSTSDTTLLSVHVKANIETL